MNICRRIYFKTNIFSRFPFFVYKDLKKRIKSLRTTDILKKKETSSGYDTGPSETRKKMTTKNIRFPSSFEQRYSLNEKAKRYFLDYMTKRSKYKLSELTEEETKFQINDYPPYAIQWDGMTVDVGGTKNAVRKVDPRFYNGYLMLPSIITMLHAKIKKEIPSKIVSDPTNKAMINFTCRYAFLTRAYNQNSTHISVVDYLPEVKSEYLNMCKGTYQVIPVAVFIMTLYNACFMFQKDKTDNLMIKALERFDLTPNIDDNAFLKTMSEFMIKYSWCDYFIMYPTT